MKHWPRRKGRLEKLRILVADDHDFMRLGIRSLVESHPPWTVCGEARTPAKSNHWPEACILFALMQGVGRQFKLLRAYEGLNRHLRETCLHPLSQMVQSVLSQPRANLLMRCRSESHAPNRFGKLVVQSVRELVFQKCCYPF
jgi:hypothetical protein